MTIFTIENETNNITAHADAKEAQAVNHAQHFRNQAGLAKLASEWPASRLVAIWNTLPGAMPVIRFKDRATAVSRIWSAIQSLEETARAEVTQTETNSAPEAAEPVLTLDLNDEAAMKTFDAPAAEEPEPLDSAAPISPQTPDVAPEAAPAATKPTRAKKAHKTGTETGAPREASKTSQVIAMLKREGGVTLEEIMTSTGWQKHTTRAMLSAGGSLAKNHGLTVVSEKVGEHRRYSVKA